MTAAVSVPPRRPHLITLVLLSATGALAMNIFLPSLPGMARDFGVEYAFMQLSVSAFLGVSAVLQLLCGPISDRFGRRPVVLGAFGIFVLATLGTLWAPDAHWFMAFRLIQATVTVGFVMSRAVVRDIVPAESAASMIGYVTMAMSLVPMAAPILGGVLDEAFGWQASFVVMGVAALAVMAVCWFDLNETARGGGVPMRQQLATYPILARSQRFWGYALAATLSAGAFYAYLGGAPFVGRTVLHLSAAEVGYWFAAPSIGYALGNFISARFSTRVGMNRMILAGGVVATVPLFAALLVDLVAEQTPLIFFGSVAFMGLGNGMLLPNANAGMMSVRPELAGTASGLGGAMAVAGGAGLAALAGAFLHDDATAAPLLAIMTLVSLGSILAGVWVILRQAQVMRAGV
ncbi:MULTISPECIES: multidrug effflux MFS transporter [unclassified Paracoccus (in: a-proteobacteria)]|uniref:multidrug effflux MFS transporter n=1 Tax=unclassified Paracoccus (in: a-proteobacteria) TaxID=2688777 RepID=UPI0012B34D4B|nr:MULTISPECIES: multidrug effflux MFS transporter [unclassified Paracoccus (in: a-proteobacteria)]UXU74877.1 multidrug effflux MFS transporter [Paracoccus sp. SMMA_5]UXU80778.1 multidrug effflux MFS transporter [Paracoccus sp. SMMA_5_TC]